MDLDAKKGKKCWCSTTVTYATYAKRFYIEKKACKWTITQGTTWEDTSRSTYFSGLGHITNLGSTVRLNKGHTVREHFAEHCNNSSIVMITIHWAVFLCYTWTSGRLRNTLCSSLKRFTLHVPSREDPPHSPGAHLISSTKNKQFHRLARGKKLNKLSETQRLKSK